MLIQIVSVLFIPQSIIYFLPFSTHSLFFLILHHFSFLDVGVVIKLAFFLIFSFVLLMCCLFVYFVFSIPLLQSCCPESTYLFVSIIEFGVFCFFLSSFRCIHLQQESIPKKKQIVSSSYGIVTKIGN